MFLPEELSSKTSSRGSRYLEDRDLESLGLNLLPLREGRKDRANKYYLNAGQGMELLRKDMDRTFQFVDRLFHRYGEDFYQAERDFRIHRGKGEIGRAGEEGVFQGSEWMDDYMVQYALYNHWYHTWMERYRSEESFYKKSYGGGPYGMHVVHLRVMEEDMDFTRKVVKVRWRSVTRNGSNVAMVLDHESFTKLLSEGIGADIQELNPSIKIGTRYLFHKKMEKREGGSDHSPIYLSRWRYRRNETGDAKILYVSLSRDGRIVLASSTRAKFNPVIKRWETKTGAAEVYMSPHFQSIRSFLATVVEYILHDLKPEMIVFERTISPAYSSILEKEESRKLYMEELESCENIELDFFRYFLRCACYIHGIVFISGTRPGERMVCARCGNLAPGNNFSDEYFRCSNPNCPSKGQQTHRTFNLLNHLFIRTVNPAYGKILNKGGLVFDEGQAPLNRYTVYPDQQIKKERSGGTIGMP